MYNIQYISLSIISTVRAPVFDRHQFFCTSEHYGKAHGSLLSGWMNYNYTACCWFPTSSNISILPSQFWQIRFESCWLHCSKCRILVFLRYLWNYIEGVTSSSLKNSPATYTLDFILLHYNAFDILICAFVDNLKCLKSFAFSKHSNCITVWKWGFVKSKRVWNQTKIWTLISLLSLQKPTKCQSQTGSGNSNL